MPNKHPSPARSQPYDRLKQELVALATKIGFTLPGCLNERYFECTRPNNCKCHEDPANRHGPYHYWTRRVGGKTVCTSVPDDLLELVREGIENGRALDHIGVRMQQESLRAFARITEARRPQKPAPRRAR